jgi:polar amino acid transport system substrate-binding protein
VEGVPPQLSYTVRLAAWLTAQSAGRYLFEARQMPRLRLNRIVAQSDWQGVVAWANPLWFADPERQRFLWSSALMSDRNVLVSRQVDHVLFPVQEPVQPLRLGGISGHFYADLDPFIQRGLLLREDAQNDLSNVLKLQHGRVDIVVVQASSLAYLRSQMADFDQWASISPTLQPSYQRYLFTSTANPQLMAFLQQALLQLAQAPEWAALREASLP